MISSSLGYLTYDTAVPRATPPAEMDGDTAVSTRAADLAAERGVVVVISAGNEGVNAAHNTLGAPADGQGVLAVGAVDPAGVRATLQLGRPHRRRPASSPTWPRRASRCWPRLRRGRAAIAS